jgi:hypothetical protein
MKYTAFLFLLILLTSCGDKPTADENKKNEPFVAFKFPPDSFVVLDSISYPRAVLLVTGHQDFWGASAYVLVMNDSGQRNIKLNYHSLSTIKSGKLDTVQLDGKGYPEIIARTQGEMRTDFERVKGYFAETISAVDVIDVQRSEVLFSAMPDYIYEQTGPSPVKEEVHYKIGITATGISISDRKGEQSKNYPDTVKADCYKLIYGKYTRCK